MRLKDGVIINQADGAFIAVAAGEAGKSFNGMIKLNATAAFILERLKEETTIDSLVKAITDEYDVSAETAEDNAMKIVRTLREHGLIEE